MTIAQAFLPEWDQEMANTRKVLERIPEDKLDWKCHPKSNSIRWLGTHLSNIPTWVGYTLTRNELDIDPPSGEKMITKPVASAVEILEKFDANVAEARKGIAGASDADFQQPWTLKSQGHAIFTLPRVAVVRSFVINHIIHHRAIMTVYLRLNEVPVPGMYGPSGDE